MENRKLVRLSGTREDVLSIVRELEAMAEGPITVEESVYAHDAFDLAEEPRVGQSPLVTVLVDLAIGVGSNAAYDALIARIKRLSRGRFPRAETLSTDHPTKGGATDSSSDSGKDSSGEEPPSTE